MRSSALSILLFTIVLGISGCDQGETASVRGSFSGTFTAHGTPGGMPEKSGPVTVTFEGDTYRSTANPDRIPAGGSGTFRFLDDERILFADQNFWTADFDWGLILNGEYSYRFEGDSLNITRYSGAARLYEYKLKRAR